ncbi:acyl carrier protein [Nocardia arthritidis]|uniref:Carrier domain-containing protein n=1 Tax=Nocardia arthritidis TaxID=228602 RepID=A0A6G9YA00_9NOCA|nr:acyl carrier protein [Nocardia arthritidis]QIS10041.1 hypothetical protein F5544_10725 [Nocardia arthritidis]
MRTFTLDDLRRIIRQCAGEDDSTGLDADDILDVDFVDLGYDSLALLETNNCVSREFGVSLPEEELTEVQTPGAFITLVNQHLARQRV